MESIKRYIECYVPIETCNLRCHYCYITQKGKFGSEITPLPHSPEFIRKALSKERWGGVCLINLCAGGETLLSGEILARIRELLLEGHYVTVVTNGIVSARFKEISKWEPSLLKRLFIKFSLHYLEFKRLNIFDVFFANVDLIKKSGCSFTVELMPSDELMPFIDDVKALCLKNLGALCHVTIARDETTKGFEVLSSLDYEGYKKTWRTFNSELFDFKSEIFLKKRKEFCYAGDWSVNLDIGSGVLRNCYYGEVLCNIYDDVNSRVKFKPIGYRCHFKHCFNGHSFLTLGVIPELTTPSYADVRNRRCDDGAEWLQGKMKDFMSHKLVENNKQSGSVKKLFHRVKSVVKKPIDI